MTIAISITALLFSLTSLASAVGQLILTARVNLAAQAIIDAWDDKTEVDLQVKVQSAEVERHWYRKDLN